MLAVLTVLALALTSCSTAVQPTEQPQQVEQVEHQLTVTAIDRWGNYKLVELDDGECNTICTAFGPLTWDSLDGWYYVSLPMDDFTGYINQNYIEFEPDKTYNFVFKEVRNKSKRGWTWVLVEE
jgi:hypothetical protein